MIKGVVFDMDGTLVDTEKLFVRFWVEAARERGYPMERRHALSIRAMARDRAEKRLQETVCPDFDYWGVRERRNEMMEAYIAENGIALRPGAREALEALRAAGLRIGLATASNLDRAERFRAMADIRGYFDAIAVAAMVPHGKPAPDIYQLAARQMEADPCEVVAVEDAPNGILSAHDAGLHAVLVPDLDEPDEQIAALCAAVLPSLADVPAFVARKNSERS